MLCVQMLFCWFEKIKESVEIADISDKIKEELAN